MMHDPAQQDLNRYKKITLYAAFVLFAAVTLGIAFAYTYEAYALLNPLIGFFCGAALATLNLFALGYAFNAVVIKKGHRWPILWPCGTFLAMIVGSLYITQSATGIILGFALGLSVPIFFAAMIIFLSDK